MSKNDVKEFIKFKEVIQYVTKEAKFKKDLIITSDACYSGMWCKEAKRLNEDEAAVHLEKLSVLASTTSDRQGQWGAFRRYK